MNTLIRKVFIAADHQGQDALNIVRDYLHAHFDVKVIDTWTSYADDDYPDVAKSVTTMVRNDDESRGIIICGSGLGVSMIANRDPSIRAATCFYSDDVHFARRHDDINILCLSQWSSPDYVLQSLVHVFMTESFQGGRHLRRIYKGSYIPPEILSEFTGLKSL